MELDSSVSLSAIPIQWRTGTLEQPLDLWGISHADGKIDVSRQAPYLAIVTWEPGKSIVNKTRRGTELSSWVGVQFCALFTQLSELDTLKGNC